MKRNLDDIKIIEPPIGEIAKKQRGWKKACFTGCGCSLIFLILIIIGIKIAMGPGPKTVKELPDNFPKDIPVYDQNNVEHITFISGKYKNRGLEIAAFFPKIILSPLLISMDSSKSATSDQNWHGKLKNMWEVIATPVGDTRDTVIIEWHNIETNKNFVVNYYKTELEKSNYKIDLTSEGGDTEQFSFSREDGLSGSFYAEDSDKERTGTEKIILTVNLNSQDE